MCEFGVCVCVCVDGSDLEGWVMSENVRILGGHTPLTQHHNIHNIHNTQHDTTTWPPHNPYIHTKIHTTHPHHTPHTTHYTTHYTLHLPIFSHSTSTPTVI